MMRLECKSSCGEKLGEFLTEFAGLDRRNVKDMREKFFDRINKMRRQRNRPTLLRARLRYNSNPPHGITPDDGKKVGELFDPRERLDDFFLRGGAVELDHKAVFLEATGDGARENVEHAPRSKLGFERRMNRIGAEN